METGLGREGVWQRLCSEEDWGTTGMGVVTEGDKSTVSVSPTKSSVSLRVTLSSITLECMCGVVLQFKHKQGEGEGDTKFTP